MSRADPLHRHAAVLREAGLRTIDHAFAATLHRLDPDTAGDVLLAAALASHAVAAGHAGLRLDEARALLDADIDWPQADDWARRLAASRWVAAPGAGDDDSPPDAPLVLEHGLLYLRRYREYERRLASDLRRIGSHPPDADGIAALAPLFARLFPQARSGDDRQARAAAVALRHRLVLVTGGPGTGKTTTIARLLVLLAGQARQAGRPEPRIAMAAPTGRAAERMADSLRRAAQALEAQGIEPALLAPLHTRGSTLHRLLGTIPGATTFRHHAENPLEVDIVVVDEASMVDLPLMAKLMQAVPDGARVVLLGDPDQLPSVEAGDVLAGILAAAGSGDASHDDDAAALAPLLGEAATPEATGPLPAFPARHVRLTRGWRQSAALDLAPLATAVRDGGGDAALALLEGGALSGVHWHPGLADPLADPALREHLLAHWQSLADARDPVDALARAGGLRLLTAVREGPQGARTLNARIEALLAARLAQAGLGGDRGTGFFHGRLLLVTENSYRHGLFNGDTGICLRDADGTLMAWFPGEDAAHPRAFHPANLPAHHSAFAMTVHKAQGSEFDEVWLLLPARDNRVLARELVYTGLTRARSALHLAADAQILRQSLGRAAQRWSGLGWRLRTCAGAD